MDTLLISSLISCGLLRPQRIEPFSGCLKLRWYVI